MSQSKTPPPDGVYQEKVVIDPMRIFANPDLLNSAIDAAATAIESRMRNHGIERDPKVAPNITIFVTMMGRPKKP